MTKLAAVFVLAFSLVFIAVAAKKAALIGVFGFSLIGLYLFRQLFRDAEAGFRRVRLTLDIASALDNHRWILSHCAKDPIFAPPLCCGRVFLQHYLNFNNIPFCQISPGTALPHLIVGMPNIFKHFSKLQSTQKIRKSLLTVLQTIGVWSGLNTFPGYPQAVYAWPRLSFVNPTGATFGGSSLAKISSEEVALLLGCVFSVRSSFMASASVLAVTICLVLALLTLSNHRLFALFVKYGKTGFRRRVTLRNMALSVVGLLRLPLGWFQKVNSVAGITAPAFAIPTLAMRRVMTTTA